MAKRGKYNKTIKFLLPKLPVERLNECIDQNSPSFPFQLDSFYSFLWDIVHQLAKVDDGNLTYLYSGILQDKYVNYTQYRDYLVESGIIKLNKHYQVDKHSMSYEIHPDLLSRKIIQVEISIHSNAGKYIINRRNKEIQKAKKFNENLKILRKHFNEIKFDFEGAYTFIEEAKQLTDYQYICAMDSINRFQDDNKKLRYFKRNKTNNRIDNNLSSLPSYLKQFINSNKNLVQLDLKNSQPVLFNSILNIIYNSNSSSLNTSKLLTLCYKNNNLKEVCNLINKESIGNRKWVLLLKEEMERYKYYTSNGTWYEHLAEVYNSYYDSKEYDRLKVKPMWMAIAYSSNWSKEYKQDKIPFEKEYPCIAKVIRLIKKKDYKQFAITLQKVESEIFIDLIAPELIRNEIIPLTVHDCVIVPEHQVNLAHTVVIGVLEEQLGFAPKLDVKALIEMTEIKAPRKVKKRIESTQQQINKKASASIQESEPNLKKVMQQFINEERNFFMGEINNNKAVYEKLVGAGDFILLTKIFIEEDLGNLSFRFLEFYEEVIEL